MLFFTVGNIRVVLLLGAYGVSFNWSGKTPIKITSITYTHSHALTHTKKDNFACRKPKKKKPFNKYNVIKFQNYTRYYNLTNTITNELQTTEILVYRMCRLWLFYQVYKSTHREMA